MYSLPRLLHPPEFPDPEQTRLARLIHRLLWAVILIAPVSMVITITFVPNDDINTVFAIAGIFAALGLMALLHRGYVRTTGLILCLLMWGSFILASLPYGGLHDRFFTYLVLPILIAGVVLGGKGAALLVVLSSLVGFVQVVREGFPPALFSGWIGNTFVFSITALVISLTYTALNGTLRRTLELNQQLYFEIERHKRTSEALGASDRRYKQLLELAPVAISVIHQQTQTVLYTNPAALRLIRGTPETVIGQPATMFVAPESLEYVAQKIQEVIDTGHADAFDWGLRQVNGGVVQVNNFSVSLLFDQHPAILSAYTDLTEYKRAQEALLQAAQLKAEMEQEKRYVQLKENFLSMASHQLRTPLSIILSSRNMLVEYADRLDDKRRREHLDRISAQALTMTNLLNDLLTLSKASSGILQVRPEPLALDTFCGTVVEELALAFPQHKLIFSEKLPGIYLLDPSLLRHVLHNLIVNASKYSPLDSEINITLERDGEEAVISVRDHGMGIPPDDQAHIFDPFIRGSNARSIPGTGLGLPIVKNNVDLLGGSITFQSTVNIGTTFFVRLPLRPVTASTSLRKN
ncbi:MAG: ATP-binding protein [bacterium]|nr:ATP-binding protein [bacterium]